MERVEVATGVARGAVAMVAETAAGEKVVAMEVAAMAAERVEEEMAVA